MFPEEKDLQGPVVVVGTGLGGASVAWSLADQGREVLLVELGDFLKAPAKNGRVGRYIIDIQGDRETPIHFVGGQTKFYGAALYRFRESDFREVRHESGISPAWPITYQDLEPYYAVAESLYRVHGSPDGDPSEPHRSGPYPYPPIEHQGVVAKLVARMKKAGVPVAALPRGLDRRPGGACVLCADCDAHFCTLDAKMDAEIAALRPAMATGKVKLRTNTEVLKVVLDDSEQKAVGVLVRTNGIEEFLPAQTVVVSAGLPSSALLLRRSASPKHPDGLGNRGGALGKYLAAHSVGMVLPFITLGHVPPTHTKTFGINAYYENSPGWPFPTGIIQAVGQMPFWEEALNRIKRPLMRIIGLRTLVCFYMTEALPSPDSGLIFEGDQVVGRVDPIQNFKTFRRLRRLAVKAFGKAGYLCLARRRAPYIWHEVGTARMGHDPQTSVVTPDLKVHGVDNLYVVDASVCPSAAAVNTGLTIVALALRLADHLTGRSRAPSSESTTPEFAA